MLAKFVKKLQRKNRIRQVVSGTAQRPRLSVFRSNANIYAQLIDDVSGKTLCSASDIKVTSGTKTQKAHEVWQEIAKKALDMNISSITFDRWGNIYHGRVKALGDGARSAGLQF